MASVDDVCEVVNVSVDKKLTEDEKISLFKKLEFYPCLWDSRKVCYKDKNQRNNALETLGCEFHLTENTLKRLLHSARTALVREVKKEQEGQKSRWKFFQALSFMTEEVKQTLKEKDEKEWTEDETENLIQFYKVNESMWNHKVASYKDRNLREVNLAKLKENLPSRSQDDVKKQWHILKTIFGREIKREEDSKVSGAGVDSVYKSKWRFFEDMMFVKGTDDVDKPVTTLEDSVEVKPPTKRLKVAERDVEEAKLDLFKEAIKFLRQPLSLSEQDQENTNPQQNDEIGLFVKSLESTLRRFTPRQRVFAKKRINDVMFELEMGQSTQSPSCTATCSSQPVPSDLLTGFASCTNSLQGWPPLQ